MCMCMCAILPHLLSPAEGVYGTQSASMYCIKISNVQIDSDVLKKASRYTSSIGTNQNVCSVDTL